MSIVIGLTGSIGMGKSTTARIFEQQGCAVWDADDAVHRLYAQGGAAVTPIAEVFPEAIVDAAVSRERLKAIIAKNPKALDHIERIVHPLVILDRQVFVASHDSQSADNTAIIICDIPLLFETGADREMEYTVTVSTNPAEQRKRVLARGNMTAAEFERILEKQMPDAEKRKRADYIIWTDTPEHARDQVRAVLADIKEKRNNA